MTFDEQVLISNNLMALDEALDQIGIKASSVVERLDDNHLREYERGAVLMLCIMMRNQLKVKARIYEKKVNEGSKKTQPYLNKVKDSIQKFESIIKSLK